MSEMRQSTGRKERSDKIREGAKVVRVGRKERYCYSLVVFDD